MPPHRLRCYNDVVINNDSAVNGKEYPLASNSTADVGKLPFIVAGRIKTITECNFVHHAGSNDPPTCLSHPDSDNDNLYFVTPSLFSRTVRYIIIVTFLTIKLFYGEQKHFNLTFFPFFNQLFF